VWDAAVCFVRRVELSPLESSLWRDPCPDRGSSSSPVGGAGRPSARAGWRRPFPRPGPSTSAPIKPGGMGAPVWPEGGAGATSERKTSEIGTRSARRNWSKVVEVGLGLGHARVTLVANHVERTLVSGQQGAAVPVAENHPLPRPDALYVVLAVVHPGRPAAGPCRRSESRWTTSPSRVRRVRRRKAVVGPRRRVVAVAWSPSLRAGGAGGARFLAVVQGSKIEADRRAGPRAGCALGLTSRR